MDLLSRVGYSKGATEPRSLVLLRSRITFFSMFYTFRLLPVFASVFVCSSLSAEEISPSPSACGGMTNGSIATAETKSSPAVPPPANSKPAEVKGPCFGQKPPCRNPEIFAPGILSVRDRGVTLIAFSPDGRYLFFVRLVKNDAAQSGLYWVENPFGRNKAGIRAVSVGSLL
jgi:hypothetical protein